MTTDPSPSESTKLALLEDYLEWMSFEIAKIDRLRLQGVEDLQHVATLLSTHTTLFKRFRTTLNTHYRRYVMDEAMTQQHDAYVERLHALTAALYDQQVATALNLAAVFRKL